MKKLKAGAAANIHEKNIWPQILAEKADSKYKQRTYPSRSTADLFATN